MKTVITRKTIPRKTKEDLLNEYNHRCAVCGCDQPHIHHIDENASNNELMNLLPLCPNHHLSDQHNPTRKIDIPKLQLFRKYKDPAILKPQFHPIYTRQIFLEDIMLNEQPVHEIARKAAELIDFVHALEKGAFYGKKLTELIGYRRPPLISSIGSGPDPHLEKQVRDANLNYRQKLIDNRESSQALLIELLRYQDWATGQVPNL